MFHHRHHATWALVLIIVVVLGSIYHFSVVSKLEKRISDLESVKQSAASAQPAGQPSNNETAAPAPELNTYENTSFGYSLLYPKNLDLKEYNARYATIGHVSGSGDSEVVDGKTGLTAFLADNAADKKLKLDDYIFQRVKSLCDADGAGISTSCPKRLSQKPLKLESELPAYILTLEKEEKAMGPEAFNNKSDAVFFVVDLSTSAKRALLVIYPVGDGTVEAARTIAESVKR